MSSNLPEDDLVRIVQDFGLGPYLPSSDSPGDSDDGKSEDGDLNASLPGTGPSSSSPELLISYPVSSAILPGDAFRPPRSPRPEDNTIVNRVPSVSQTSLPSDEDNPSSHSDYYDDTVSTKSQTYWADEDAGVYAGSGKNDSNMENYLNGLGNYWSGSILEDISGPYGFPSDEYDVISKDPDTSLQVSNSRREAMGNSARIATNIELVADITKDFIKEFGKKDLTRRHVMSYVTSNSLPQFLVSDIIRCMKLSHNVYIKDVLDEFPISNVVKDGRKKMASINESMLSLISKTDVETNSDLIRCSFDISDVCDLLDSIGGRDG